MIVRDEEALLPAAIKSVKDFVSEIIIVDTGSVDGTIDICRSLGATVHSFEWCDDFSAARNHALSFVRTPWTLWLDADDLVLNPEVLAPATEAARKQRVNAIWSIYKQDDSCYQRRLQLFKTKDYSWQGFVHENPIPKNMALSQSLLSELSILHRKPPERGPAAALKYLALLKERDPNNFVGIAESYKYLSVHPDDPEMRGQYRAMAEAYYHQGAEHPDVNDQTRYLCFFHCARLNLERGGTDEKWLVMAHRQAQLAVALAPHRAECWVILGQCWELSGNMPKAVEAYQQAEQLEPPMDDIGLYYPEYYNELPRMLLANLAERLKAEQESPLILPKKELIVPARS